MSDVFLCSPKSNLFFQSALFPSQYHFRESYPDSVKNRLHFRYHVYRSLYFLEQGSVKGVKKEVKASSDFYLLFSSAEESEEVDTTVLDNYECMTSYDGYLPPLLKTRLEYRRGNCLKILSLLTQIYEEDEEDKSLTHNDYRSNLEHHWTPEKDYFYFSMMASIYFASHMETLALHYLFLAYEV